MVIPEALKGKDIAGQAQTGTGKTVAFLVPLMARLLNRQAPVPGLPRALVVTPTRELAEQIYSDGKQLASFTGLSLLLVIGGMDYREQAKALETGPDIVVGTPGRLTDYIHKRVFNTSGVEVSIVDEADRLLELGFIRDLKFILSRLPSYENRQTMLFSATLNHQILELVYNFMNPPQYITAEPGPQSRGQIAQELYHVTRAEKLPLLLGLLKREEHSRIIIFCNTQSGVDWLAKKLVANGYHAEGITGDLPQPKRLRLMQSFKDNQLDIMVATDVASRGIHVEDVSHVFNYDIPQDAEAYVHRIGRTGRVGKTGKAVSFACEEYVHHLEAIENILGAKIPVIFADDDLFLKDRSSETKRRGDGPSREGQGREGHRGDRKGDRKGGAPGARKGEFMDDQKAASENASKADQAPAPEDDSKGEQLPGLSASAPSRPARDPKPPRPAAGGPAGRAGNGRDPREEAYAFRGLAFTSRPGGVYGLAPKLKVTEETPDVRFELSWKPSDIVSLPNELPVPEADAARTSHAAPGGSDGQGQGAGARPAAYDDLDDYRSPGIIPEDESAPGSGAASGPACEAAEPGASVDAGPAPAGPAPGPNEPVASDSGVQRDGGAFVVSPEAAAARAREDASASAAPADGSGGLQALSGQPQPEAAKPADGAPAPEGETSGRRRRRRHRSSRNKAAQAALSASQAQDGAPGAADAPDGSAGTGSAPVSETELAPETAPDSVQASDAEAGKAAQATGADAVEAAQATGADAVRAAQETGADAGKAAPAPDEAAQETHPAAETEDEALAPSEAPAPAPATGQAAPAAGPGDAAPARDAEPGAVSGEAAPPKRKPSRPSRSKAAVAARAALAVQAAADAAAKGEEPPAPAKPASKPKAEKPAEDGSKPKAPSPRKASPKAAGDEAEPKVPAAKKAASAKGAKAEAKPKEAKEAKDAKAAKDAAEPATEGSDARKD
ncbi:MAG: DEAD/DEAH box helicase [Deltaproteobacteria bacterium]|nr:DEAD/DEAH box helicase [Deltaproteobacteria bacterium]